MSTRNLWALTSLSAIALAVACGDDNKKTTGPGADGGAGGTGGTGGSTGDGGGTGGSATGGTGGGTGGTGTGGTGGGTGGSGTGGDAGMEAGAAVSFSSTVVAAVQGNFGNEAGLEGVEVCVADADGNKDQDTCVTTDADGNFEITGLEPNTPILLLFEKDGYATQAIAADIGEADIMRPVPLRLAAQADGGGANFGWDPSVTQDSGKGMLSAVAVTAAAGDGGGQTGNGFDWTTGVSFEVTPTEGNGPFYVDIDEQWVDGADSTQGGWGAWFLNLSPREYTVTAMSPTMTCSAAGGGFGWAQDDGSAKAPVLAGVTTQAIVFLCTPTGDGGAGDAGGNDAGPSDASTD